MAKKVTIQDIADAMGLSRNTVSKAINNTGILAKDTRERIIQKSIEMGYINVSSDQFQEEIKNEAKEGESSKGEIALFTGMPISTAGFSSHFASIMLDKFQNEITKMGYTLTIHLVTQENLKCHTLPITFLKERASGIMCIELFNMEYIRMVEELKLPLLLLDAPYDSFFESVNGDIILMDNTTPIFTLIKQMKERGIRKIGYVGQATHCRSFFERYMAFRDAMFMHDLPIEPKFCLTNISDHGPNYREHLIGKILTMEEFPELFICANDFIALDLMLGLKLRKMSIPEDIMIFGFDNSPESKTSTPTMSTCHIHSQITGYTSARLIKERIKYPDKNYLTVHTETTLHLRESTGNRKKEN